MDINQSILKAIATVVDQRLNNLQFDNTVTCKIVDNSRREIGEYTVEYANKTKFYAYADIKDYSNGTMVYVSIPNGDWNAEKRIVGRQNASNLSPAVQYIHPMDTIAIYGADGYGDTAIISAEVSTTPVFDESGKQKPYKYTLNVPYYYETENGRITGMAHLTSANILGDPCDLPVPQKVSVRIQAPVGRKIIVESLPSGNGKIPEAWAQLVDPGGGTVTWSNAQVIYGLDLSNCKNETVKIATTSDLEIASLPFKATLKALWINKNTNNTYIGFEKASFRSKENATQILATDRQDSEATYYWVQWFQRDFGETEWREVITNSNKNHTTLEEDSVFIWEPSEIKSTTEFKACIYKNGAVFTSNILKFMSKEYKTQMENPSLIFTIDGEKEYFDVYDANGTLTGECQYNFQVKYGGWSETQIRDLKLYDKPIAWSIKSPDNSMIENIDENGTITIQQQFKITSNSDNTIVARVEIGGQIYAAEKILRFNMANSGGNGYYIYIDRDKLFDYDYTEYNQEAPSSYGQINYILYKDGQEIKKGVHPLNKQDHDSLRTTISVTVDSDVVARRTVPLSIGTDKYRYIGPTTVTYDSFGSLERTGTRAMKFYNDNINEPLATFNLINSGVDWSIKKQDNSLIPPSLFITDNDACISICINGEEKWRQKIVIIQDRYSSQFVNDWDGSLTIDKQGKSIMSALIGAGSKDQDGAFTGVLMGDVQKAKDRAVVASGLLGYHSGVQTFGFQTDGTAFIKSPKSSQGIYFNANPKGSDCYFSVQNANRSKYFKIDKDLNIMMQGGLISSPGSDSLKIDIDDGIITSGSTLTLQSGPNFMVLNTNGAQIKNNSTILLQSDQVARKLSLRSFDFNQTEIITTEKGTVVSQTFYWVKRTLKRSLPGGINIREHDRKASKVIGVTTKTSQVLSDKNYIAFYFPAATLQDDKDANINNNNNYYPIYGYYDDSKKEPNFVPFLTDKDIEEYIKKNKKYPPIGYIWRYGASGTNELFPVNVKNLTAPNINEKMILQCSETSDSEEEIQSLKTSGSSIELVDSTTNPETYSHILLRGPEGKYIKIGGEHAIAIYASDDLNTTPTYTLSWENT